MKQTNAEAVKLGEIPIERSDYTCILISTYVSAKTRTCMPIFSYRLTKCQPVTTFGGVLLQMHPYEVPLYDSLSKGEDSMILQIIAVRPNDMESAILLNPSDSIHIYYILDQILKAGLLHNFFRHAIGS